MTEQEFNALTYDERCAWVAESLRADGYNVPAAKPAAVAAPAIAPPKTEAPRTEDSVRAALRASWARAGLPPCPAQAPRPAGGPETSATVAMRPDLSEHPTGATAAAGAWSRTLARVNGQDAAP